MAFTSAHLYSKGNALKHLFGANTDDMTSDSFLLSADSAKFHVRLYGVFGKSKRHRSETGAIDGAHIIPMDIPNLHFSKPNRPNGWMIENNSSNCPYHRIAD